MMGYKPNTNAWMAFMEHAAPAIPDGADVFEIGPGNHKRSLVGKFCRARGVSYFWGDLNNRGRGEPGFCQVNPNGTIHIPFCTFDAVVSFQMLHNCERPWKLLPELARVCKPGGVVVVVDSMYEKINRHPVDCGRVWPDGLKVLFGDAGLVVEKLVVAELDGGAGRKNTIGHVAPASLVGIGRKPE